MMSNLRREDGMTLPELLVAITIAMIVSLAAFALIEVVMKRTAETQGRVEASQRGRQAMDTMTRQLRSQVCLSTSVPPMAAATGNSASFYVDLTDGTTGRPPELHTVAYSATTRRLMESDYVGTGTAPAISYPPMASPSSTKTLAENVEPIAAGSPIFRYYAYDTATPPRPAAELPVPLSAANLGRVARIKIEFRTLPPKVLSPSTRGSIVLQDEIYIRAADPNDPAPTPTCA